MIEMLEGVRVKPSNMILTTAIKYTGVHKKLKKNMGLHKRKNMKNMVILKSWKNWKKNVDKP